MPVPAGPQPTDNPNAPEVLPDAITTIHGSVHLYTGPAAVPTAPYLDPNLVPPEGGPIPSGTDDSEAVTKTTWAGPAETGSSGAVVPVCGPPVAGKSAAVARRQRGPSTGARDCPY